MMEKAMKMFAPFAAQADTHEKPATTPNNAGPHAAGPQAAGNEIDDLRRRLDELAREIGGMGKK